MDQAATQPVPRNYQVFINHRGTDVKKTLASVIYHRLTSHGLRVFLDKEEFRIGDSVAPTIFEAIDSAYVHIAIFSKRYAESRWCLDELCAILACHERECKGKRKTKILPVFWDVDPEDLCSIETRCYAKAFKDHQDNGRDIEKWKTALKKATDISGKLIATDKSYLGQDVETIVEAVLKESWYPLYVAKYPVGLEEAVEDFQNEIKKAMEDFQDIQSLNAAMIVGITGMAGVGKSTLAKHLYNLKRPQFSRSCFLSEIRKSKESLPRLQEKLICELLLFNKHLDSTSEGKGILQSGLHGLQGLGHQVLIVLDDVDSYEQIDNLLDIDVLRQDNLILITSSDKCLLKWFSSRKKKRITVLYNVKLLHGKHARELFCEHAEPSEIFEDLVTRFLNICSGLPLSLTVTGETLRGKADRVDWEQQLELLSTSLPDGIINPIKQSYEALKEEDRDLFLDIACFFIGEDRELAVRVLDGSSYNNVRAHLEILRAKCLVDYYYDVQSDHEIEYRKEEPIRNYENLSLPPPKGRYIITMHDQVRELARQLAGGDFRGSTKPLLITCSNDILRMNMGSGLASSRSIRGIGIRKGQNVPAEKCVKAVGVRFFVVEVPIDLSSFFGLWKMEGELVWLRLANLCSFDFPSSISLGSLRVLELKGNHVDLELLFQRFDKPPCHLSELDVNVTDTLPSTSSSSRSFALEDTDKNISDGALQRTSPYYFCLRFLEWIGFGMRSLSKIVLKNFEFLQSFPIDFSELAHLRHLDLSGCSRLHQLPNSFSKLTQLEYLALRDCKNLSIPHDILGVEISKLKHVDFKGCAKLVHLPTAIANQTSLRYLNLLRTNLLQLSINLEQLRLKQLRIGSPQLTELPRSVGNLKELEELILVECSTLKHILPEEVAGPNIKVLVIGDSPLTDFRFQGQGTMDVGMPVLRDFTLKNTSISEICIPEGVYPCLETVDLSGNFRLMQVNGLPSRILRLNLQGCKGLKTLTNLSNLVNLKLLNINQCNGLKALNVEGLASLEKIKAEACWTLKRIEGSSQLKRLNSLHISTNNKVVWHDICEILTSPDNKMLSTVIFSGRADDKTMLDEQEMLGKFKLKLVEIVYPKTRSEAYVKIENFDSHGGILMCFVTSDVSARPFTVRFDAINYNGPVQEYTTLRLKESGKCLYVFMWRKDSDLFREYKDYSDIDVYCSELRQSEKDGEHGERGWLVMVGKNTDISEVCKEIINAFT